jgi:signal transduction histidine kinase
VNSGYIHAVADGLGGPENKHQALSYKAVIVIVFVLAFLFTLGIVGASSLTHISEATDSFSRKHIPSLSALYSLDESLVKERFLIKKIATLSSGDTEEFTYLSKRLTDEQKNAVTVLGQLDPLITEEADLHFFEQGKSAYKDYSLQITNFLDTKSGEISNSKKADQSVVPLELSAALDTKAVSLQDTFFTLGKAVQQRLEEQSVGLLDTEAGLKHNLLMLLLMWLLIAVLVGVWISKNKPHIMTETEAEHERELSHLNSELNIRNKKLAEQEVRLEETNSKLKNIDALKSEFVSIVAHQLRTPLAGIKWTLDMLISGDLGSLSAEQKTFLLKIHEGNERMIRFVNDLLSINRIEMGRLEYNFTSLNLQHVAESVLLDIYPLANKKQIEINFRGKGLKIPQVAADPEKIRVAFQNILENAVKYTPVGGHITMELRNRGNEVLTTISDDGIGMPKEEQKGVFNRFYRAPSAVKMQTEGSGLGLYLVKAIVEAHGGKVWFDSDKGKGTTFYFSIPVPRKDA